MNNGTNCLFEFNKENSVISGSCLHEEVCSFEINDKLTEVSLKGTTITTKKLTKGDMLLCCSDGIYCNFDPKVLRFKGKRDKMIINNLADVVCSKPIGEASENLMNMIVERTMVDRRNASANNGKVRIDATSYIDYASIIICNVGKWEEMNDSEIKTIDVSNKDILPTALVLSNDGSFGSGVRSMKNTFTRVSYFEYSDTSSDLSSDTSSEEEEDTQEPQLTSINIINDVDEVTEDKLRKSKELSNEKDSENEENESKRENEIIVNNAENETLNKVCIEENVPNVNLMNSNETKLFENDSIGNENKNNDSFL